MRDDFLIKNFPKNRVLLQEFEIQKQKILRMVRNTKYEETIHLNGHIEKNPHKEEYYCWMNLYFPRKVFHVKQKASDALTALKNSCGKLFFMVKKHKDKYISRKRGRGKIMNT